MCQTEKSLSGLPTDPLADPSVVDARFADFAGAQLARYLTSLGDRVGQVERQLSGLRPIGIAPADEYRSSMLAAVRAASPKIPRGDGSSLEQLPVAELKTRASQVAEILKSLKPKEPDLAAVANSAPELANAHSLAIACDPPTSATTTPPLPSAANGTDVTACQSGKCQIQVTSSVQVSMSGLRFTITVASQVVVVSHDKGLLELGPDAEGSFGDAGRTVRFRVTALKGKTAVVDIASS